MKIKCYNPKCNHEREYKGKFTDDNSMITCTKCRHKLRLGKAKVSEVPHKKDVPTSQKTGGTSQKKSEVGVPHGSKYKKEIVKPKVESIDEEYYLKDEHGKKYKPYTKNLGTATTLEPKVKIIRTIPYDPLATGGI